MLTFEEATKQYFDQHERKWRNPKHRLQFLSSLKMYAFPKIGRLSVAAIDTGLVLKCIEPIWQDKTETASRVRGRIESVLDWAVVRGSRKPYTDAEVDLYEMHYSHEGRTLDKYLKTIKKRRLQGRQDLIELLEHRLDSGQMRWNSLPRHQRRLLTQARQKGRK